MDNLRIESEHGKLKKIKLESLEDCKNIQDGLAGETVSQGEGYSVTVSNAAGYMCHISLCAYLPCHPSLVHRIMRNPDNSRVFRDIKATPYRHVVFDDPRGLRVVMAKQVIEVAILPFVNQDFMTLLKVTEDVRNADDLKIKFEMVSSDIMSRFNGHWSLTSVKPPHPDSPHPQWAKCILEQDVLPRGIPPWLKHIPVLGGILRGTGARAVKRMMEDLIHLVKRINNGEEIQKVLKNERGEDFVIQSHFVKDIQEEFFEEEEVVKEDDGSCVQKQNSLRRNISGALQTFQQKLFFKRPRQIQNVLLN